MVAAKWKQLSPEEKKKYSEKVKFLKLIRLIIYQVEKCSPRLKRAPNAYNIFMKENFEFIKQENPGETIQTLNKLASEKWKNLSIEEKKKYSQKVCM